MQNSDHVTLKVGDATLSVSAEAAARAYLEKFMSPKALFTGFDRPTAEDQPPPIGCQWMGGIYAGIVRGRDKAPDYHLIVGDAMTGTAQWKAAMAWAASLGEDWSLPFRTEQSVCYANVPELFEKEWYWSREEYAGDESYAWYQNFSGGSQDYWGEDYEFRARAVRRLPIESFAHSLTR